MSIFHLFALECEFKINMDFYMCFVCSTDETNNTGLQTNHTFKQTVDFTHLLSPN